MDKLIEYILVAGFTEGTIAATILYFFAPNNRSANRILSLFVLMWALVLLDHLLYRTQVYSNFSLLSGIFWPLSVALGPALYVYSCSLISTMKQWQKWIHFTPLFVYYLMLLPYFTASTEEKISLLYGDLHPGFKIWQISLMSHITLIQFIIYTPLIIRQIKSYRLELKKAYSNIEARDVSWLNTLIFMSVSTLLISFIGSFDVHWIDPSQLIMNVVVVFSLFYFSFMSLRQMQIPEEVKQSVSKKIPSADLSSVLDANTRQAIVTQIKQVMDNDKPYLDFELSLEDLAQRVNLDKRMLSQVLNHELDLKFYDFINQYRIEDAIERLRSDPQRSFTQLAAEVGFKSRTTFYSAFKKFTGTTPRDLKQNISS